MAERISDEGEDGPRGGETVIVRRRSGWRRVVSLIAIVLLIVIIVALVALWAARRPLATHFMEREFKRRGVQTTYRLDRVGLRTQQVSNLVIGDPERPDLIAKYAQVQLRVKWNGTVEVYRIVARGVRLRGRVVKNRVSWGQIDRLMPPPSNKPFALPNFVVDVADTSISLMTPQGPLGIALQGAGNLSGGFKGHLAAVSPQIVPGRCRATNLRANVAVEVVARHPHVVGPVRVDRFTCAVSRFDVVQPRFEVDARANESFTDFDGGGRMAIASLTAGENGLANFAGDLTFKGDQDSVLGSVKLSAQRSRLASIYAERTRMSGRYRLGFRAGTFVMVGDYGATSGTLAPSMLASITGPLAATEQTPVGPVAKAVGRAIARTTSNFGANGTLRMVNFPGGGAVRIDRASVTGPQGARVAISGGDGITYYWPGSRFRLNGNIAMGGGGLPTGRVAMRQPRNGAPMSGVAEFRPYVVGSSRLALAPIRFAAAPNGSTQVSTIVEVDGPFPNGRIEALRVPITGRFGNEGSLAVGTGCAVVSFRYLRTASFQLGPTRLPACPIGGAMLSKPANGPLRYGASFNRPVLDGRIGASPLHLTANDARIVGQQFAVNAMALRLGRSASPIIFDAARLGGNLSGKGIVGNFSGARSTIGNVPLAMSEMAGKWAFRNGDLNANGAMLVSDRAPVPRFYPMRSNDFRFNLAKDMVRAGGTLIHPASGARISDVTIDHRLSSGVGHADLDVPGITFGKNLQPEELTRLTEGVIALVNGTISGRGRIDWVGTKVTSSGDFTTPGLDLAAPFGPVTGMRGTVHFNDLLALSTSPGQTMTIASINPGILVENGVIRYQLLPNQLVKVERGEWPFMGGRLVLQETILNFSRPTAKRLTFQVIGLNANTFVQTMGFPGIEATGIFDGVLPMIFDESGGRIVGGRLDSRPGGGSLAYTGPVGKLGMIQNLAFNALKDLRFRSMIIRLDGELAGEFAARLAIDGVALGQTTKTQKIIKGLLKKVPLKLNVNITGPFRALIATAKSMRDPTQVIGSVLPRPLDEVPGIVTEVRRVEETQTAVPPNQPGTSLSATPPAQKKK
ncbi:MAG: YdbH domain-containing protein [Sphingomicrobium sp.]